MKPPKLLYHYTNAQGLLGLIKSQKIWASSYRYMNDSKEFEYGFDLIEDIFPKQETDPFNSNISDQSFAEQLRRNKWNYETDCLFVSSFSESKDLLSQWRAYSGPHSGYAIGFRTNELEKDDAHLVKCEYNKEKQKLALKHIISDELPALRKSFENGLKERSNKEYPDHTDFFNKIDKTVSKIANVAVSFKHKSFFEENEWRLVIGPDYITPSRILYRPTDTAIIPYVEIDFTGSTLPIECLIVGPGPHQKRNELSLRKMLEISGLGRVDVAISDIPYRNW